LLARQFLLKTKTSRSRSSRSNPRASEATNFSNQKEKIMNITRYTDPVNIVSLELSKEPLLSDELKHIIANEDHIKSHVILDFSNVDIIRYLSFQALKNSQRLQG
jgi:hypothetical protein